MLPLAWILLLSSSLSGAVSVIYRRTGDEVVISSGSDPGRITAITWKHNMDIAVEWYGGEPSAYRHFNGHTTLDIWTGALTISNLTRDHSGSYTAEINNRIADTTEVRVISSVIYKGPGDEVVIPAGSDLGNITAITWKHYEDIAVKWYGGEPSAYRHFNDHTTLDKFTGALTISGLTRDHSGFYTAEINDKVISTTEVRIISPVPKPTVSEWCDTEKTYCTLTCKGNTTDSELVTYSWQTSGARNYSDGQWVNVTKVNTEPWYRCVMENPISSETSEEFPNPLSSSNWVVIFISVFMVLLLIGCLVGGIYIYCKCKSKKENAGLNGGPCNGVVPAVSAGGTSAQNHTSHVVLDISSQTAALHINGTSNPDKTSEKPGDEPATTTSEGQEASTSVAEMSHESATDSQDQNTSSNHLQTAASTETEESTEESNVDETTIPLLKQRISVSA